MWFSDRSKSGESIGVGFYGLKPRIVLSFLLDRLAKVFQPEVFAIHACTHENVRRGYMNQHISILLYFLSLAAPVTTSNLVLEYQRSLAALRRRNWVTLIWIPGHTGVEGIDTWNPSHSLTTGSCRGSRVNDPIDLTNCTQTRFFIKRSTRTNADSLLRMSHVSIGTVTGLFTGHIHLHKHINTIGLRKGSHRRYCSEDKEASIHIFCECHSIMIKRHWISQTRRHPRNSNGGRSVFRNSVWLITYYCVLVLSWLAQRILGPECSESFPRRVVSINPLWLRSACKFVLCGYWNVSQSWEGMKYPIATQYCW